MFALADCVSFVVCVLRWCVYVMLTLCVIVFLSLATSFQPVSLLLVVLFVLCVYYYYYYYWSWEVVLREGSCSRSLCATVLVRRNYIFGFWLRAQATSVAISPLEQKYSSRGWAKQQAISERRVIARKGGQDPYDATPACLAIIDNSNSYNNSYY